ncbi:TAT pathway signal sequence protein [Halorhabdus tiamatea SARL4B]|uniref:TAT pathway signal sequence protein n=2 Tax=Halorhabdus tiamatea SARL4B TaxID=1033806 RepID=F7PIL8_9EURY|nr:twin-arginine translocation signal domain-containing protein [Halorhabdus tiamatea]ERJ07016.1 TAT pathway signal sequence protein [Halorhabdus tiamatea SARL4B]
MGDTFSPDRRTFLSGAAATGAVATAGCSFLWDQPGATDVILYSGASQPRTVTVSITRSAGNEGTVVDRTMTVDPGETVDPVNQSKLPLGRPYTVTVTVENGGSETFNWESPDIELAPLYIFIDDTANVDFLLQTG